MSKRPQRGRVPIDIATLSTKPRGTVLSTLQATIARDVSQMTLDLHRLRSGYTPGSKTADEGLLLSWPNLSTLRLYDCLLPAHELPETSALENVREFYYSEPEVESGAANLLRVLRLMPSLQHLSVYNVVGDLEGEVLPPVFHLRSYCYHSSSGETISHWYHPLLNSYVSLKVLSLRFETAPPASSVRLVAGLIGPSLETLTLDWNALLPSVAGILIPACRRLQSLKLGGSSLQFAWLPSDETVRALGGAVVADLRTPLRSLSIGHLPGMLGHLVAHVMRHGLPPSMRSLRQMHLAPSATRRMETQVESLARACIRRRIRLSFGLRAVLQ